MDRGQSQGKKKRAEEESIEGASTSSSISPESIDACNGQYDVFLSFRGSDTCKAFTDHLYHSLIKAGMVRICLFKDDKSIPIGEKFDSQILDAITRSKISIPIISENYASSKWCLRELTHIMDCKKRTSHMVLPIFYKVEPSDVRYLKGSFGEAFHSHKNRFDKEEIQEVERALREVSDLHGWESEKFANGHEGELVEKVVENILSKLRQDFQLDVTKYLVGIGDHVNKIRKWIDSPTGVARMIGIYGMGGIGKTTLAKAIYNQLSNDFMHRSFLADIRETAHRNNMPYLQKQLIKDIQEIEYSVGNVDYGISLIKSTFKGKKVLLLLDDIDDKNQLDALARERDWFVPGSMIVVTTRNEAVLDQSEFEVDYKYELNGLDKVHALLLFNRHAFRMDHSPKDFDGISHDIISTMGGLPLALKVVGSYLYKKEGKGVWEDVRKKLKNQPNEDVEKILQISYDALEKGHKQIFLDIVCFFIGKGGNVARFAMYMWEDCGFYPNQGIEELKLRCLIKIGDHGKFMVHDQLRDLGRSIFCQEQSLRECSGPWDDNYQGVRRVVRHPERRRPWFHDFLRAASSGDPKFSEVRWLEGGVRRNDASLSTINLHMPKLSVLSLWEGKKDWKENTEVVLKLGEGVEGWEGITEVRMISRDSEGDREGITEESEEESEEDREGITEDWEGITEESEEESEGDREGITEDWEGITENWEGWKSLKALKRLKVLRVQGCSNLGCTPELSAFTQLKILVLSGCDRLERLHPSIGKLTSLVTLDLCDCRGLKELPEEVGGLKDLEELLLDHSGIIAIPSSIGSLRKLKTLSAISKSLREIPSSIGDLQNLQDLQLQCSAIKKLPSAIGGLKNLKFLNLIYSSLEGAVPSEIGDLSSLEHLDLNYTRISDLPESVRNLSSLQSLQLIDCVELRSLPALPSSLQSLNIMGCYKLQLLPALPSSLQYLNTIRCYKLWSLPELPSGLTRLLVTCQSLRLPQLLRLIHLELLDLKVPHFLEHIYDLSSINSKLCFEKWDKLTSLSLNGHMHLEELSIKKCSSIEKLELSQLIHLKQLRIEHCDSLFGISRFKNLESLEVIFLYDCNSIRWLSCPESKCLKKLVAVGCDNLVNIEGLDSAEFLEELDFTGCKSMETLPDLTGCEKLQSLRVRDCKKLTKLQGLEKLNLIDLDISGCDSLVELSIKKVQFH